MIVSLITNLKSSLERSSQPVTGGKSFTMLFFADIGKRGCGCVDASWLMKRTFSTQNLTSFSLTNLTIPPILVAPGRENEYERKERFMFHRGIAVAVSMCVCICM